jgi:hypothetical protein
MSMTKERPERASLRKDRRNWIRADMVLPVRLLDSQDREFSGKTINTSGGGLLIATAAFAAPGETVIAYVDGLGRMSGKVIRSSISSLALSLEATPLKRDRLVDQITWLANRDALGLEEDRRAERQAAGGPVLVTLDSGRVIQCRVLDMSLVGVGLATTGPRPLIGERVKIGSHQFGRCARYLSNGFAVDLTRI